MAGTYRYPDMERYLRPFANPGNRKLVGRTDIIDQILATFNRPEISNGILLGPAGSGKTTIAYMTQAKDKTPNRDYYEVILPLMSQSDGHTDGSVEMAARMTRLVDQVQVYQHRSGRELVLFMDEIHQVIENSPAAMEALKPILANSGSRGIKILGATTYEEYNEYIRKNEALNERFERISVPELSFDEVLSALREMVKANLKGEYVDERLLKRIIEVTNEALPSQQQPRKSLRILDGMLGRHKAFGDKMDEQLLANILKMSVGVDINYQLDIDATERKMNARVFDQSTAIRAVMDRLYISVAGLNDHDRPRGSFLFSGPTGAGKTELAKTMANVLFGSDDRMIRFDMSEYSQSDSVERLRRSLTEQIWEYPSSVVLLDEIEKAAPECTKLMLQVLDDARMTDEHGREVSFKDSYLVFTTNAGAGVFQSVQASSGESLETQKNMSDEERNLRQRKLLKSYMPLIMRALKAKKSQFPPELLGRFDQIVPFSGISEATRYKICDVQLKKLSDRVYREHAVTLHIDHAVQEFIVREHLGSNDTENGGGREVRRRIDENVVSKVAEALVRYPQVRHLAVYIKGSLAFQHKRELEGSAEVAVGQWEGSNNQ